MKNPTLSLSKVAIVFLLVSVVVGCNNNDHLKKRISELEKKLDEKEQQVAELAVTVIAVAAIGDTPLQDFFNAPEFWESTYEVDPTTGCLGGCSRTYQSTILNTCSEIKDEEERQACVDSAYARMLLCTAACRQQ